MSLSNKTKKTVVATTVKVNIKRVATMTGLLLLLSGLTAAVLTMLISR